MAVTGVPPFVGRARELGILREAVADACGGRARFVLLGGEPGIGKTRTAEEVAAHARESGMQVSWGRCYEGEGAPAFWPWVQLLRAVTRRLEDGALRAALGWSGAEVAQLVPELRQRLPDLGEATAADSAQARFRLFETVTHLLENLAREAPLLCVLDDLHGGDRPSLLLLEFVARELRDVSMLLLGSYREGAVVSGHPLMELVVETLRLPGAERLSLSGLSPAEVAEFMERTSGVRPAPSTVAVVHQRTEGNPLFVGEYVRLLCARQGAPALNDPEAVRALTVPESVRALVLRRIAPLSPTCRAALRVGAIMGREFYSDVVEVVLADDESGTTEVGVLAALDEAAAAGIISEGLDRGGRYRFAHAVMQEALYEDLAAGPRMRLHRRVGEALEQRRDAEEHLAELAHHFGRAATSSAPGRAEADTAKAVSYARRAGERAMSTLAYEEAVRLYQLAVAALDRHDGGDQEARCGVLVDLGVAQYAVGEREKSKETLTCAAELAEQLGLREELGRAALHYGTKLVWGEQPTVDPVLVNLLEKALAACRETESSLHARLLARLAIALRMSDEHERRFAASDRALAMARRLGEPAVIAHALHAWHAAHWRPDNLDERLAVATELTQRAGELRDLELLFEGHSWRLDDFLEQGDRVATEAEIHRCQQLADELEQPGYRYRVRVFHGMLLLLDGHFTEAEQLAQEGLELGKTLLYDTSAWFAVQLLVQCYTQGQRERFEALMVVVSALASQYPSMVSYPCALAYIARELGDVESARARFERLAGREFADLPHDHLWLLMMHHLAEACAFIGDRGRAAMLAALLEPYAARAVTVVPGGAYLGPVSNCLGVLQTTLGRWDNAEQHFEQALAMNRRMRARPSLARTQYEYGRMLLLRGEAGDEARARGLWQEALATAREFDMELLAERVEKLGKESPALSRARREPAGAGADDAPSSRNHAARLAVFRREGHFWTAAWNHEVVHLKDCKGAQYMAHLLRHPGQEFLALDLLLELSGTSRGGSARARHAEDRRDLGPDGADLGPTLDARAKQAYRERLEELREELEEATRFNDLGRSESIRSEMESIAAHLQAAFGLHGRDRPTGSAAERARLMVTKRIKYALDKIDEVHPALAHHLRTCVKTGYYCSYTPPPGDRLEWEL